MSPQELLAGFDHLVAGTRVMLEAVPEDKMDWRPHDKSWSLGKLAAHIATLPNWTAPTLSVSEYDVSPADGEGPPPLTAFATSEELLTAFENSTATARNAIAETTEETLAGGWTMLVAGEPRFTMPKSAVMRGFILDHMIHHRAQLGVYLRLLDVPVPPMFGPTADFPDI